MLATVLVTWLARIGLTSFCDNWQIKSFWVSTKVKINKKSFNSVLRLLIGSLLWGWACPPPLPRVWLRGRQSRDQGGTKWRDQSRLSKRHPPQRFNGNSTTPSYFPPLQWFLLFHWFLLRPAEEKTKTSTLYKRCISVFSLLQSACSINFSSF